MNLKILNGILEEELKIIIEKINDKNKTLKELGKENKEILDMSIGDIEVEIEELKKIENIIIKRLGNKKLTLKEEKEFDFYFGELVSNIEKSEKIMI